MVDAIREMDVPFTGVLNGGFFKTKSGIKFMEWNGRFGDPEALNVLSVLEGSFAGLLKSVWDKTLSADSVKFAGKASVVKYMVAKEYPESSRSPIPFMIDEDSIGALGDTIGEASRLVDEAIASHFHGDLEYRHDIGTPEYVARMKTEIS